MIPRVSQRSQQQAEAKDGAPIENKLEHPEYQGGGRWLQPAAAPAFSPADADAVADQGRQAAEQDKPDSRSPGRQPADPPEEQRQQPFQQAKKSGSSQRDHAGKISR